MKYQKRLIELYAQKYEKLVKNTTIGYKRTAINAFITEHYCDGPKSNKYIGKHTELT